MHFGKGKVQTKLGDYVYVYQLKLSVQIIVIMLICMIIQWGTSTDVLGPIFKPNLEI